MVQVDFRGPSCHRFDFAHMVLSLFAVFSATTLFIDTLKPLHALLSHSDFVVVYHQPSNLLRGRLNRLGNLLLAGEAQLHTQTLRICQKRFQTFAID